MPELPEYSTLKLGLDGAILEICLCRPDQANAISATMWEEIQAAFEWADACSEVRVVILAGEGKHFCAGIDLSMFEDIMFEHEDPARASEQFVSHVRALQQNIESLRNCRKPVIAAIHGACIGAGIDMTCYADMRFAEASAVFCVKEIDIGIVADVGTLQNLPSLIPEGLVRELAFTGRNMDAEEARQAGFINRVFDDRDLLMAGVRELAATLAAKSPLALRGTKQVLNYTRDHSVEDGLNYVALWNAAMMSKLDVREAMTAKLEKRIPDFLD